MMFLLRIKRWLILQKRLYAHAEKLNLVFDELSLDLLSHKRMPEIQRLLALIEDNRVNIESIATVSRNAANRIDAIEMALEDLQNLKSEIISLSHATLHLQQCVESILVEQKRTQKILISANSGRNSIVIASKDKGPQNLERHTE